MISVISGFFHLHLCVSVNLFCLCELFACFFVSIVCFEFTSVCLVCILVFVLCFCLHAFIVYVYFVVFVCGGVCVLAIIN